jgi:ketosteroid isomerase-like protein
MTSDLEPRERADRRADWDWEQRQIRAIEQLKYRYLRCLDLKQWDELASCLTPDATSRYSDGRYAFEGRDAIMAFLRKSMDAPTFHSSHSVNQPEIQLTSETSATGIWHLEDVVIESAAGFILRGAGHYEDVYAKLDGEWKIRHTGYRRIFEETQLAKELPGWRLSASRWSRDRGR